MGNLKSSDSLHLLPQGWKSMTGEEKFDYYAGRWVGLIDGSGRQDIVRKYQKRAKRVLDVLALKEPDQVPAHLMTIGYLLGYGGIQPKDAFYNPDKVLRSTIQMHQEFDLDYYVFPGMYSGPMLDILGSRIVFWPGSQRPGQALPDDISYQYVEDEYMREDEYDQLISQPEGYVLRRYLPRIFPELEGLASLPNIFNMAELTGYTGTLAALGKGTQARKAIDTILNAADQAQKTQGFVNKAASELALRFGVPGLFGGHAFAPFDLIGDTMRCTVGIMKDLYRRPEKVKAAMEALIPMAIQVGVQVAENTGNPFILMPLHKGSDIFLSPDQFKTFYWPPLKQVLQGFIDAGCVPILFLEGSYDKRLEIIAADPLPEGKSIWIFSQIDMKAAKALIGPWGCIAGNVPASLFKQGSVEMLEAYCKDLIETCAPGGGFFMFSGAILDQANPENIRTYLESASKYGTY